jgi:hypothetical protein
MIPILNKTNIDPADSEYPFGNIRDKTTLESGTPVNVETYSDMHQFFMKMIAESNIVPNNLPDNAYNGWQLWEALLYHCRNQRNYDRFYMNISQASTNAPTIGSQLQNDFGSSPIASYVGVGQYNYTFPAGTFPTIAKVWKKGDCMRNGQTVQIDILSDTVMRINTYDATGAAANDILANTTIAIRRYT